METKFKKLRTDAGVSQDTIAKELGVSRACVSAWENGKRSPDSKHLFLYMKLFNLDSDFFDEMSSVSKKSTIGQCFDMSRLNAKGVRKMYDFYLSLLENEEYLKKS